MRIAVTTASGGLGSAVIKTLRDEIGADSLVGIARTPEKAAHLGVEIRKGDYNNRNELKEALRGIDAVLLVSGMDHPDNRIGQHRNVIEAAKSNGVKKIVYTSIIGSTEGNNFSPIVASNRQTEEDVKASGLEWAIGRNGLYLEPDLEYIDNYVKEGGIINSAADGRCGYTSRSELAFAYCKLLLNKDLNGGTYNLFGTPITQSELASAINNSYSLNLEYKSISVNDYIAERKAALGDFLGMVIGGIYEGIRKGNFDQESDYSKVTGRAHKTVPEMIEEFKSMQGL